MIYSAMRSIFQSSHACDHQPGLQCICAQEDKQLTEAAFSVVERKPHFDTSKVHTYALSDGLT